MEIAIIALILAGIVVHRYLTTFEILGLLPWNFGFRIFVIIFYIGCLMNSLWMFGFIWGIIVFLLILFQVIFTSILWVFLIPTMNANTKSFLKNETPKVDMRIYSLWSIIPILLIVMGIANFFIADYKYILVCINKIGAIWFLTISLLVIVVGNLIRIRVLKN